MKPKQYYELGKSLIVLGQVVFGTRVLYHLVPDRAFDVGQFVLSLVATVAFFLLGLYLVGKGGE